MNRNVCWLWARWSVLAMLWVSALNLFSAAPRVLYETGFEASEGFDPSLTLVGQGGWVGNGSGGNGLLTGFFEGRGQHAFVGFSATTNDALVVWRPVNYEPGPTNPPLVRFSVLMWIEDSVASTAGDSTVSTNRDDFRWSVYNIQGNRLFSLDFDNDALEINYLLDDDLFVSTGRTFSNFEPLQLEITMNFATNGWSSTLNGSPLTQNLRISTTGLKLDFGDVDAVWAIRQVGKPGNNFMVFDDYRVAAEEASVTNPPPRVEALELLSRGQFLLRCLGTPGARYVIEATTDLTSWSGVKTNRMPEDGFFEYLDSGGPPQRFYRAVER